MKADLAAMRKDRPAILMPGEERAINQVLEAGERYGYGNMITWLITAWEKHSPGMFTGKHPWGKGGIAPYPVDWIKR